MLNIENDTIQYIASFLYNLNDYKKMMILNKEIYSYLYNFQYKKIRIMREFNNLSIKYSAIEEKNDDDLYYPSSFNNPWNLYNCIKSNCPDKNLSLGVVHIYTVTKDEYDICYRITASASAYIYSENSMYIKKIVKNRRSVRRYIPYCKDCMEKYINSIQSNNYIIVFSYSETLML